MALVGLVGLVGLVASRSVFPNLNLKLKLKPKPFNYLGEKVHKEGRDEGTLPSC